MCSYKLFLSVTDTTICHNSRIRVDLYNGMKISAIEELKEFNIMYVSKGHNDTVTLNGNIVKRKVRYIQVFESK